MNLQELIKDVRSLIIEPTPGFRSDDEIKRWLNQAHQELAALYQLEASATIELQPSTNYYNLPDDFLTLRGAWDADHNSISISPGLLGNNDPIFSKDQSQMITVFGKTLILSPPPAVKTSITIFYIRKAKILTANDDVPEIPEPYHRYLVAFATMRALEKDEAFDEAQFYLAEYEQGKNLIMQRKTTNLQDLDLVTTLLQAGILNPAEAAQWLNLPMKEKIWQRVEVEDKALNLLSMRVISKEDLMKNTVFPDRDELAQKLATTANDIIPLPPLWEDDIDG